MEVPVAALAVAEVHLQTVHEDRVNEMQGDKALSALHHSMHLAGPVEVGFLKKKSQMVEFSICGSIRTAQTLRLRAEVSLVCLGRVSSRGGTRIAILWLTRPWGIRLCRMSHGSLQQRLIVTAGFNELLIKLGKLIWKVMSMDIVQHRKNAY